MLSLILGRLGAVGDSASVLRLDRELAERAIGLRIAEPLGLSAEAAAIGVVRLLEQHLVQAIETVSSERGRDPVTVHARGRWRGWPLVRGFRGAAPRYRARSSCRGAQASFVPKACSRAMCVSTSKNRCSHIWRMPVRRRRAPSTSFGNGAPRLWWVKGFELGTVHVRDGAGTSLP